LTPSTCIQELAGGLTAGLSPAYSAIDYDELIAAFDRVRPDGHQLVL